jgi:hypothetical protein
MINLIALDCLNFHNTRLHCRDISRFVNFKFFIVDFHLNSQ